MIRTACVLLVLGALLSIAATGCESRSSTAPVAAGEPAPSSAGPAPATATPAIARSGEKGASAAIDLSIPDVQYRLDPAAGDKSVPAELGGPGFTGEGWETRLTFPAIGSSEALKGGSLSQGTLDWPATLRVGGKNWNSTLNYVVRDLCFPFLLTYHPVTLEYIPALATHWQISADKMTYRFRINPAARWSDGSEVTAEDYVASYRLWMDPTILFPSNEVVYGKFTPHAISKYIIEIRCKEENWRNLPYAGGLVILSAKDIGAMTGTEFLEKYQFSYPLFCGPYRVDPADIVMNQSVTLTRNPAWWDAANPAWTGMYNIDKIRYEVVKEDTLTLEKVKRGELDYYVIPKAKWFVEDLPKEDAVRRGLVLRMKVFNDAPVGTQGMAINASRQPLDDVRIRKALAHLLDRKTMIEKLFFDEYAPLTSYWQGAMYGSEKNVPVEYDEYAAEEALVAAGWTARDAEGWRVKDGKVLEFDLMYRGKESETYLTLYQESAKRLGIRLHLRLFTPSSFWKNLQEKEYDLAMMNWGALVIPNPETSYKGELAAKKDNNNVTAFADPKVDELLVAYDREYDVQKRRQIIKDIDSIVYEAHPYALAWYKPAQRVVVANKFGWPKWGTSRVYEDTQELIYVWWVDPAKEKALEGARKDSSKTLPIPPLENRFWPAWNAAHEAATSQ